MSRVDERSVLSPLLTLLLCCTAHGAAPAEEPVSTEAVAREIARVLPVEAPYASTERLSTAPVHVARRDPGAVAGAGEMEVPAAGWKIVWSRDEATLIADSARDFQDYLHTAMGVEAELEARDGLADWQTVERAIVVGTRASLPGCGAGLIGPKDYAITVTPERITVCGHDARGVLFGLHHVEARMNLREAPVLPADWQTVRHSLYDTRMVQSWMGWMAFPDRVLSHLAHDGFDAIFASVYTNPTGDRTTAEGSTDFYARLMHRIRAQDPARVRSGRSCGEAWFEGVHAESVRLWDPGERGGAASGGARDSGAVSGHRGIRVADGGLLVPTWGGGHGASREYIEDWARNWSYAVGVVAEKRMSPGESVDRGPALGIQHRFPSAECGGEAVLYPAAPAGHNPHVDVGEREGLRDRWISRAPAGLCDQPGGSGGGDGGANRGGAAARHEGLQQSHFFPAVRSCRRCPTSPFRSNGMRDTRRWRRTESTGRWRAGHRAMPRVL